jgi:Cytotoxic translational repressor of toxin-antitoxin stability system
MADVEISLAARDELEALEPDIQDRITEKLLEDVAERPDRHLVRLSGRDDYRVRVGDYRVIVEWDKTENTLRVTKVEHRDTVYD